MKLHRVSSNQSQVEHDGLLCFVLDPLKTQKTFFIKNAFSRQKCSYVLISFDIVMQSSHGVLFLGRIWEVCTWREVQKSSLYIDFVILWSRNRQRDLAGDLHYGVKKRWDRKKFWFWIDLSCNQQHVSNILGPSSLWRAQTFEKPVKVARFWLM